MNIFFRPRPRPKARPPRAALPAVDCDEEAPPGCGWFVSSQELHSGLWVREHASAEDVVADLPLGAWLELHLAGWPVAHRD
ncbi:MAG TPA: hypothetical protein VLM87_09360 [Rubrivivax sp.]|nr:hypothetical protein [Rubrivivax sp.]